MKGLKEKIINGEFPSIPEIYGKDLNELLKRILEITPAKRISIEEILDLELIRNKIPKIIKKNGDELKTFLTKSKFNNVFINPSEFEEILKGKNLNRKTATPEKIEMIRVYLEQKIGSSEKFHYLYNFIKVIKILAC